MNRFLNWLKKLFDDAGPVKRFLGRYYDDVKNAAKKYVLQYVQTTLASEEKKRRVVALLSAYVAKAVPFKVPGWVISAIVDYVYAKIQEEIRESEEPKPQPVPKPEPTYGFRATIPNGLKAGDRIYVNESASPEKRYWVLSRSAVAGIPDGYSILRVV